MSESAVTAWRCIVCGYVHEGPEPPAECPVCGAAASEFEPCVEPPPAPPAPVRRWRCVNCNYVYEGAAPPDACPICGAGSDQFEAVLEPVAPASGVPATRVVIIGAGVAGVSAAEAARRASPASSITLVSGEAALPYYRLNLTRYLAGEIDRDALPIHPAAWYAEQRMDLLLGAEAIAVDLAARVVRLRDGREAPFQRLVLAMGSHPFVPPLPGTDLDGVMTLRTAADADRLMAAARAAGPCVCIGGGILGIETAGALARQGADVTLLESLNWLMPRQLTRQASARLKAHMLAQGIRAREGAFTAELRGTGGRVKAVVLKDGTVLPAGLVVITTGIRPNTYLANQAGIEVRQGVIVDNRLRSSHPDVFAAGDVAEHNGVVYGVWGASQYQGSVAGLNAVGVEAVFGGLPRSNALKVLGVGLLSVGQFEPTGGDCIVLRDETASRLHHFVFRDACLVGCILFGDVSAGAAVKQAIETGRDFSAFLAGNPRGADVLAALT